MNDYIIETNDLTKKYGNQVCVSHISLHVKKGTDLWSAGPQRSRENDCHAHASWAEQTQFRTNQDIR